jgi:hypothetical protein
MLQQKSNLCRKLTDSDGELVGIQLDLEVTHGGAEVGKLGHDGWTKVEQTSAEIKPVAELLQQHKEQNHLRRRRIQSKHIKRIYM